MTAVHDRRTFTAEFDMCDLDERGRPGPAWTVRGQSISRSHIQVRSRRMCYTGRRVGVAIHLIDDQPCVLLGTIQSCEYDTDGRYAIEIAMSSCRDAGARDMLREWFAGQSRA